MVVGLALAAVQMGMALPTGFLFGVGYGTGVRIGYEQVYPLLFPKGARPTTTELAATMKGMNTVYDAIGGKDASRMGIAVGITNAGEILNNPDFQVLEQLESSSSGLTSSNSSRSRFGLDQESAQQAVSSDIAAFNKSSGADWYVKFRAFSIQQILNWRSGTGHDPLGYQISGQVLVEKQQTNITGQTTSVKQPSFVQPNPPTAKELEEALSAESAKWIAQRDASLKQISESYDTINAINKLQNISIDNQLRIKQHRKIITAEKSKLRTQSNDFRHPNNFIRQNALTLRQILQTL